MFHYLAATTVNLEHFKQDLMAGDPVAWCILVFIVAGTAFTGFQKLRGSRGDI